MATFHRNRIVEGSCWSCKRRRIKCGLETPSCKRCRTAGIDCSYSAAAPVKWVGGAALRGRYAPARRSNSLMISPPLSPTPDTERLVLYFSDVVLPRFQLMHETLPLDLNLLMQESLLQQAILAVAQGHFGMLSPTSSPDFMIQRRHARYKAIQTLRRRLGSGADPDYELFAANVLMGMLEGMIDPSESQSQDELYASMCHLKGGYALLHCITPAKMLMASGLHAHLLSIFATMDLVHALLGGSRPYFESLVWHMFSDIQAWWGRLSSTDRFLNLLKTFSEMARLGSITCRTLADDDLRVVEKCLPSIESGLSAQFQESTLPSEDCSVTKNWSIFCSLYELTGIIYLHRALRLRPVDDEAVQKATKKAVKQLLEEALPGMMAHCVIFPMLVIGAHCIDDSDRKAVARALAPSKEFLSFGSIALMDGALKAIWSRSNVQATWWEMFEPVAERVFIF